MNPIAVEQFVFTFPATVRAEAYETKGATVAGWPKDCKVVDFVCIDPGLAAECAWLVEAKDFRVLKDPPKPANLVNLPETMASKVRDSLRGMQAIASLPEHRLAGHAAAASAAPRKRVVLHLEPHSAAGDRAGLFPVGFSTLVHQKLKYLVQDIDPEPLVLDIARTPTAKVPWTVV